MKFVWSPKYEVDLFGHVFPVEKYRLVRDELLKRGVAKLEDFVQAPPARRTDLELVHTRDYLDDLFALRWSWRTGRSEMALTEEIRDAYLISAGGTICASEMAISQGACMHIGGGYHHAYPDHAEGFCYINDVAVAIQKLKRSKRLERVVVIDCDLHQGNGTAFIFASDPTVFTFSIHQENNYPPKERSDCDIGLPDGADDELYIKELSVISEILQVESPDIVFYLAGADPYLEDKLGGLCLSKEGLARRDELVLCECKKLGIPVCIVLAGGYAIDVRDDVEIHVRTAEIAKRLFG